MSEQHLEVNDHMIRNIDSVVTKHGAHRVMQALQAEIDRLASHGEMITDEDALRQASLCYLKRQVSLASADRAFGFN